MGIQHFYIYICSLVSMDLLSSGCYKHTFLAASDFWGGRKNNNSF